MNEARAAASRWVRRHEIRNEFCDCAGSRDDRRRGFVRWSGRTDCLWRDLPKECGRWHTVHTLLAVASQRCV
ncbi:hypothetical protein E5U26_24795 [Burkholderia pseudomallei]|nr:hypothetical protein [Burkholderia pseudomallei]